MSLQQLIMLVVAALIVLFGMWLVETGAGMRFIHRYVVLRRPQTGEGDDDGGGEKAPISPATTTPQHNNNSIAITATEYNALLLQAKAEALAALVHAKKITETEGIKLVFDVSPSSSNPRYLAARDALKAELAKLDKGPVFFDSTGAAQPPTYPVSGRRRIVR